jgi:hypothetical protein
MSRTVRGRLASWVAVAALAGAVPVAVTAVPAVATTAYVVDTVTDSAALSACTAAAADCSLRGAVAAANASAGVDTIAFDIPAGSCPGGVCRLTLTAGPITITDPVHLDGTTQPQNGAPQANVCATATQPSYMRIELVSDPATGTATIFRVSSATRATTIKGFAFGTDDPGATAPGISVDAGSGHQIACNHFALEGSGVDRLGLGDFYTSIDLELNASQVVVGTDGDGSGDLAERNVFGDTGLAGVDINGAGGSTNDRVSGNYFGLTANGASPLAGRGVWIRGSTTGNLIGSNLDGISDDLERNYFGGAKGVFIDGSTHALNNHVVGNVFGSTPVGTAAPMTTGVEVSLIATSTGNEIRDNYIGAATYGIYAAGTAGAAGFHIEHNVLGTGPDGQARPNGDAIRLSYVHPNVITGNLIAGSTMTGLALNTGVTLVGSTNNCIVANTAGAANFAGGGPITLDNNWWGSSTGPSGAGSGTGDSVSADIDFTPWLTADPGGCGIEVVAEDGAFDVPENAAVGTSVGTVAASGTGTLAYSITAGNTGNAFAIDPATGAITTATALDYETTPAYTLTVEVGNGGTTDTAMVTIDVTDVYETPTTPTFDDVPTSHTFFADVEWLAAEAITLGCNPPDNDLFCPGDVVTRGQMAAFLHRALVTMIMQGPPVTLTDIAGSVFEADIQWLANTGITKGCNPPANDMFCPNEVVTRGQMAAFLVRALALGDDGGGNKFVDDDGSVFETDIARLAAAGITLGCNPPTNDRFCPNDPVTRGQMAAFLHRALGPPSLHS